MILPGGEDPWHYLDPRGVCEERVKSNDAKEGVYNSLYDTII
jgi:hypothetical protein